MIFDRSNLKTEVAYSDDRTRRYLLRKEWDAKKQRATVLMTNASVADVVGLDFTTLYILNNTSKLDFGGIDIVNLSPLITTKLKPKDDAEAFEDETNISQILQSVERSDVVIIAWGKLGENNRIVRLAQERILERMKPFADKLHIISNGRGMNGFHPLAPQIRFEWVLEKFAIPEKKKVAAEVKTEVKSAKRTIASATGVVTTEC